ncbi:MAG: excinuclease ABC subunit UvrC [Planctomycetes bacterium]|nr:excinuclease ABC subunit UvrC [Planctomycetota bacterium]
MNAAIVAKVAGFPTGPGCYVFLDAEGRALYAGKAANLRARVRSYLRPGGDGRYLLRFLEKEARDVEFVATATEQEALLLEHTICRQRKPRFNIKLKDDKSFLMLRLDRREDWPWFRLVRRRKDDGAEYFGPFASAKSVRRTLAFLHKVVPLRDCRDGVFRNRSRPCIQFEMGRCPAPCVGRVGRDAYAQNLARAVDILSGGHGPVLRGLRDEMRAASERLEFERAAALKAQIEALERIGETQHVVRDAGDVDVLGLHRGGDGEAVAAFLLFRNGRLESARRFELRTALPDELLIADLLSRFYAGDRFVPGEVLVHAEPDESRLIEDWLAQKRRAPVRVRVPRRGASRRHLELATENARLGAHTAQEQSAARGDAAERLMDLCALEAPPLCIHCIDVSTTQGRETVASRVAFVDGAPDKSAYRRFRIADEHAGDDFAAMEEAVGRSLRLCQEAVDDRLPDLLVVDGGQGQLAAAQRAAIALGLRDDVPVIGLAKSRLRGFGDTRARSAERLVLPSTASPLPLADGAPETLLLAALRDEAHRFAITFHRKLRGKLTSALDDIEGVGPSRRRLLLSHFGSVDALRKADLDALRAVPGLPAAVAERVFGALAERAVRARDRDDVTPA